MYMLSLNRVKRSHAAHVVPIHMLTRYLQESLLTYHVKLCFLIRFQRAEDAIKYKWKEVAYSFCACRRAAHYQFFQAGRPAVNLLMLLLLHVLW
jgi:hypothetical protein